MTTFATMRDRIADELARSDLASQIGLCIKDAIKHYERQRFYFTESRDVTFATVNNQEYYDAADAAAIPNYSTIDLLRVTVSGFHYNITADTYSSIDELNQVGTVKGIPDRFCYYAQKIRLFPIPNAAYTVRISGIKRLDVLSADGDSNAWTTEGEALIRFHAKALVCSLYLKDHEEATASMLLARDALQKIEAETAQRAMTGSLKATGF